MAQIRQEMLLEKKKIEKALHFSRIMSTFKSHQILLPRTQDTLSPLTFGTSKAI